jgi:hypothetical protein
MLCSCFVHKTGRLSKVRNQETFLQYRLGLFAFVLITIVALPAALFEIPTVAWTEPSGGSLEPDPKLGFGSDGVIGGLAHHQRVGCSQQDDGTWSMVTA